MHRWVLPGFLAVVILGILAVPAWAMISVSGSVSPSGSMISGTNVTVTQNVFIQDMSESTWVHMTTDLTSPSWQKTLFIDGVSSPLTTDVTSNSYISYIPASHPNATQVYVLVVLTGIAPSVSSSTNERMMQVEQYDSSSTAISGTVSYLNATVNPKISLAEGNLKITSSPSGAKVYFNSTDYQGTTPLNLTNLSAGTYKVTLKKSGYKTWGIETTVSDGSTATVSATLVEQPEVTEATTSVTSAPPTATPTKRITTKATTPEITQAPAVATTESPVSVWVGLSAICVVGILAMKKK